MSSGSTSIGNVRTLDKVIRREMRLVEGDAFNTNKMQRSKERIKNLGFFKKVETNTAPGSAPDRTVVTVEVEEQSTGELSLGVGFSTTDGPLADITVRERNFLGRGQDLRIGTVVSFRSQQVDLSFTEPYFLDSNMAAGFDLFEVKTSPTASFFSGVQPGLPAILLWRFAARRVSAHRESAPDPQIHRSIRRYHQRSEQRLAVHRAAAGNALDLVDRPGAALRPPRQPDRSDQRLVRVARQLILPASALASSTSAARSAPAITIPSRLAGC